RPNTQLLPGDDFVLSFDIQGAKVNASVKILYSVGMEVTDNKGKVLFRQIPNDLEADAPPRRKSLPACPSVQRGLDQEPGQSTIKVSVKDRPAGVTREITETCDILPKAFGLVRLTTPSDREAKVPTAVFRQSQPSRINFAAVGFGHEQSTGQPH